MKVLITGVAGFIGSRLAEAHLAHGNEVVGIDNLSTGRVENVPRDVDFHHGDINIDLPASNSFHDRFDVIYHTAASYKDRDDWERDSKTNVCGTINVVRKAQRCHAKLVYFQL